MEMVANLVCCKRVPLHHDTVSLPQIPRNTDAIGFSAIRPIEPKTRESLPVCSSNGSWWGYLGSLGPTTNKSRWFDG